MQSYTAIIDRWGSVAKFADAVGTIERTAQSWRQRNSIPAEWFLAVARAAEERGFADVTVERLAALAEDRRLGKGPDGAASGASA